MHITQTNLLFIYSFQHSYDPGDDDNNYDGGAAGGIGRGLLTSVGVAPSRGRVDTIGTDPHWRFLGKWNCGRRLIVRCQGNGADGSKPDPGVKGPWYSRFVAEGWPENGHRIA